MNRLVLIAVLALTGSCVAPPNSVPRHFRAAATASHSLPAIIDVEYASHADAVADATLAWNAGDRRFLEVASITSVAPGAYLYAPDLLEKYGSRMIAGSSEGPSDQWREQIRAGDYAWLFNLMIILKSPDERLPSKLRVPEKAASEAIAIGDPRLLETADGWTFIDVSSPLSDRLGSKRASLVFGTEPESGDDIWIRAEIYNLIILRSLPDDLRFLRDA